MRIIKNRWTGAEISRGETWKEAVSNAANLAGADLTRANLTDADLTDANLTDADLTRANLTAADLTDADLADANLTAADLTRANLTGVNLTAANLTAADLTDADLTAADLTRANLTGADLTDANLTDADLADADFTRANLTGANGFPVVPVVENLDAKILAAIEAVGMLEMTHWHKCETTHCRAGWAIVIAGEAGKVLEDETSSYLAARLIYEASRPGVPCPNFFASNEDALSDIKDCAAKYAPK